MELSRSAASSYLLPYQEQIKEPTLVIPMMPDLGLMPEPLPPRRPPPPGYDMKTYRRQIEFLQEEINARVENYNAVCNQNEMLFVYVQELVKANDFNVNNMRDYCRKVHEELRVVKRERAQLVEKLEFMVNSKRLLADLSKDLEEAQISAEEMVKRRQEAESALRQALDERQQAEEELVGKVEQMKEYEDLLHRYNAQHQELQKLELAEEFFFTNRTVLKSAYARFKQGVQRRMRISRIHELFTRIYRMHLRVEFWRKWKAYVRFQHRCANYRRKRQREIVHVLFARWKVFSSYERLSKQSARLRILQYGWTRLMEGIQHCKYEKWADETIANFKQTLFVRQHFSQWKQQTMFLDWYSTATHSKEETARTHHLKTLFHHWKYAAVESSALMNQQSVSVQMASLRTKFHEWRYLCLRSWKYRGRLLRRFIQRSRVYVSQRVYYTGLMRKANVFHWLYGKRKLFRAWKLFARQRGTLVLPLSSALVSKKIAHASSSNSNHNGDHSNDSAAQRKLNFSAVKSSAATAIHNSSQWYTPRPADRNQDHEADHGNDDNDDNVVDDDDSSNNSYFGRRRHHHAPPPTAAASTADVMTMTARKQQRFEETTQLLAHYQSKLLRTHYHLFQLHIYRYKTQHVQLQRAKQHHLKRLFSQTMGTWYSYVRHIQRSRHVRHVLSRQRALYTWLKSVKRAQYKRRLTTGIASLRAQSAQHRLSVAYQAWTALFHKRQRLSITFQQVLSRKERYSLQRTWSHWHRQYFVRLLWKLKELNIDIQRIEALHRLQTQHITQKEEECQRLTQETLVLEEELLTTKQLLADKETLVLTQSQDIEEQTKQCQSLEQELTALQRQLQEQEAEKQRWYALETSLKRQHQLEAQERQRKYADITHTIQVLQEEQRLLQQSQQAQELEQEARKQALQDQVTTVRQDYQELSHSIEEIQQQIDVETQEIQQLTQEQDVMVDLLASLQDKTKEIVQEATLIQEENDKHIRQQQSEQEILQRDTGVAQARVMALLDMVEETHREQGKQQQYDMEIVELRETQEMVRLRALFQEKMQDLEYKYVQSRLQQPATPTTASKSRPPLSPIITTPIAHGSLARATPASAATSSSVPQQSQLSHAAALYSNSYPARVGSPSAMSTASSAAAAAHQHQHLLASATGGGGASAVAAVGSGDGTSYNNSSNSSLASSAAASPLPTPAPAAHHATLFEETKRLDRQYADARDAIRSLTNRLTRPLPMDSAKPST